MIKLLKTKDVARLFGDIAPSTVASFVKRGVLPPPLKFGSRNYWREEEVHRALERFVEKGRR